MTERHRTDAPSSPERHTERVRRIGRFFLVVAAVATAGLFASLLATYVLLRVDPGTVLSSCSSPIGRSCSAPVNPLGVWVQATSTIGGMASIATLLFLRRRRISSPIPT